MTVRPVLPAATRYTLLAAVATAAVPAIAVDVPRYDQQGAAAVCQPSLPAQAQNLRARPLGLTNEGTETTFVTCAFQGDPEMGGRGATRIEVNVSSSGAVAALINCTLVDGLASGSGTPVTYTTRSVAPFPNAFGGTLIWLPAELPSAPARINHPAIQCGLPPSATLHYLGRFYDEGVGT